MRRPLRSKRPALPRGRLSLPTIDIAHGHAESVRKAIEHIKARLPKTFVIAGNVATPEAVIDLENWGADATKVGVGPGKVCITKLKTGFGTGGWQLSALKWCARVATKPIIADGGIRHHGSVSLDPPLVLWSQSVSSSSYPAFRDSAHFAINILADDQIALSNHFAKSADDKFSGIPHTVGLGGAPVLDGAAAQLECVKVACYPGGDHVVYLGRIERMRRSSSRALAFASGRYMIAYAHDLGPVSLRMGTWKPTPVAAIDLVTNALPDICERVGQHTLCLAVWGNHGPTAIRWQPSSKPVSDNLRTGLVMNVTKSATGRAFAAFLPADVTRPFIAEDLRLFRSADEDEATQRQRFDETVAETQRRGIARATNPGASPIHQIEVTAFSVPIFDEDGHMVLALSLTTPATRLESDWDGLVPRVLAETAAELSRRLGFRPQPPQLVAPQGQEGPPECSK